MKNFMKKDNSKDKMILSINLMYRECITILSIPEIQKCSQTKTS